MNPKDKSGIAKMITFEEKVLGILTSPWDLDYEKADAEYQKQMNELMDQGKIQMGIYSMKRE
jgi:hypothetical protein